MNPICRFRIRARSAAESLATGSPASVVLAVRRRIEQPGRERRVVLPTNPDGPESRRTRPAELRSAHRSGRGSPLVRVEHLLDALEVKEGFSLSGVKAVVALAGVVMVGCREEEAGSEKDFRE